MTETEARKALERMPSTAAAQLLGVCVKTLQRWRSRGLIKASRTRGGRYEWDVASYLERERASEAA